MNLDPNKLTDEQLQYFLIGVTEVAPCYSNSDKRSQIRHIRQLPRKQLIADAKETCKQGWEMSDWINLNSVRRTLKLLKIESQSN